MTRHSSEITVAFGGDALLLEQGISAFGIVTPAPNWYPRLAMEEVIAAILERVKGRRVVTFGHGQGGYGALKYSACLKASVALALSPQSSINPADVGQFDPRFRSYFNQELDNGTRIEQADLCDCAIVVYDWTHKIDSAHAARLAMLRGVATVVAPFSVNDLARLATEGTSGARIISLCASSTLPAAPDLRQVIRASRKASKSYLTGMLRQLIVRLSQSHCRRSAFVSRLLDKTHNDDNLFYASLISYAKGDSPTAISKLTAMTGDEIKAADLMSFWHLARQLRFAEAEVALAEQICARLPSNVRAGLSAVRTLIRVKKLDVAHRELTRLTKLSDAISYLQEFVEYSVQLRRPRRHGALPFTFAASSG